MAAAGFRVDELGSGAAMRADGTRDVLPVVLPAQYLRRPEAHASQPQRRLMAAVLQAVVDDCRNLSYRPTGGWRAPADGRDLQKAIAYVASRDRTWPFSFENVCEALGFNAARLRRELQVDVVGRHVAIDGPLPSLPAPESERPSP